MMMSAARVGLAVSTATGETASGISLPFSRLSDPSGASDFSDCRPSSTLELDGDGRQPAPGLSKLCPEARLFRSKRLAVYQVITFGGHRDIDWAMVGGGTPQKAVMG